MRSEGVTASDGTSGVSGLDAEASRARPAGGPDYAPPVRRFSKTWWIPLAVAVLVWLSCGGVGAEGTLDPTGSEVCLADRRVCIAVPINGIAATQVVRISPSNEAPPAALSEAWNISASDGRAVEFLKRARVSFSLAFVDAGGLPSEHLLRVYTLEEGTWVPLANPIVDRVRDEVIGEVWHLSPFVVLRADRLPDGGLPVEGDGGPRDSGVIIIIPFDGGLPRPDAGQPDAGRPDAGRPDAGAPDAGRPDAGQADAGAPDAGPPDAGPPDAGVPDAGPPDAGPPDAGVPDAGPPDAGPPDAGVPDAGPPDAGQPDAGPPDAGESDAGVESDAGADADGGAG